MEVLEARVERAAGKTALPATCVALVFSISKNTTRSLKEEQRPGEHKKVIVKCAGVKK